MIKKFTDYNKEDYYFIGRWKCPTLAFEPWVCMISNDYINGMGLSFSNKQFPLDGYCFSRKEVTEKVRLFLNECLANKEYAKISLLADAAANVSSDFIEFGEQILDSNKKSIDVKLNLFNLFLDKYNKISSIWDVAIIIGDLIQANIESECKKNGLNSSAMLSRVSMTRKTMLDEKEVTVKKLRDKIDKLEVRLNSKEDLVRIKKDNKSLYSEINEFIERYSWVGTHHFWGDVYNLDKFIQDLNKKHEEKKDKLKENKGLHSNVAKLISIAGDMAWIRMYCAEAVDMVTYWCKPIMNELADKVGLSYDDFIWLNRTEINSLIKNNKLADKELINERKEKVGCYFDGEKMATMQGEELAKALTIWVGKVDQSISELKGQPACKGLIRGKARIIIIPDEAKLFEEGEILVAPETTPDLFYAMKRSAAIVTDRGGLTSHAAIVARELNKPCVVGTKHATEIIKNGDLIEVDANKGVVKILKRK